MFDGSWPLAYDLLQWLIIIGFSIGVVLAVVAAMLKVGLKFWPVVGILSALIYFI